MSAPKEYREKLEKLLNDQGGNYNREIIFKALDLAFDAHDGQKRVSGEPFFLHPFSVAAIIIKMGMDSESIAAALLHDVVEDTEYTIEDIKKIFGPDIEMLVDGVTKLGKIPFSTHEQQQAENVRKMFIAMSEDIRVIIIKLADRLHNMRTLSFLPPQKQRDKSRETLEIYAPIAHRLGIRAVKEELEDLAIFYLDPIAYREIEHQLNLNKDYREKFLKSIQEKIKERVEKYVPDIYIEGRIKSIHGIYRKMYIQGKSFDEIYDIYAVRIITDTVNNCYNILGLMHDMFRPLPGRFKDYISTPKPNMYQSLHTTVIGREGIPFEIQIRTWDMHHTAEYGIAAHWKYKEGINRNDAKMEKRLEWIRQILDSQKDSDGDDIVQTIKTDLNQEDVFAVTPKGDVINLPVGSTVIDFAFAIHTAVGCKMVGAKVNGKIAPLSHQVSTGEVIEVITSSQPGHGPNRDWISIAKTSQARSKIRAWFKKEKQPENIENGKQELEHEFLRNRIRLTDDERREFIGELAKRQRFENVNDFFAAIGYGGITLQKIMPRVKELYNARKKAQETLTPDDYITERKTSKSREGVVVEGIDNCLIKLSKCCAPLPGDNIIGFITRGHGVSIHKRDCNNVPRDLQNCEEPERWVKAYWDKCDLKRFNTSLTITADGRDGIVADVTMALAGMRVALHQFNARELKDGTCVITLTVSIDSTEHLRAICARLEKINGVFGVERTVQ